MPSSSGCIRVGIALLLAGSCAGSPFNRGLLGREDSARRPWKRFPACSNRESSALAISIVFAVCSDSLVLAAESVASASASGCGDTLAAGVGIALAQLDTSSVQSTTYAAFSAALSASVSIKGGAAIAEALALAIASADSSYISPADMLNGVAAAILKVATQGKCLEARYLAQTVIKTLKDVAPDLVTVFTTALQNEAAKAAAQLAPRCMAMALPGKGSSRFTEVRDGKGCGRVKRPLFTKDVDRKRKTSSIAVNIAKATCPAAGTASLAAVAVAIASTTDVKSTADAIAAVVPTNADVTSLVQAVFLQAATANKHAGIQAIGTAITVLTAEDQARLVTAVGNALKSVAATFGCDGLKGMFTDLSASGVSADSMKALCSYASTCPGAC